MRSVKPRQLIKVLEKHGFIFIRQKGSHRLYKREDTRVTIPYHKKDLKPGTLHNILKQARISRDELEKSIK